MNSAAYMSIRAALHAKRQEESPQSAADAERAVVRVAAHPLKDIAGGTPLCIASVRFLGLRHAQTDAMAWITEQWLQGKRTLLDELTHIPKPEWTPDQAVAISAALEALSTDQRQAYDLHLEGLNRREIAREMSIPLRDVTRLLVDALSSIRLAVRWFEASAIKPASSRSDWTGSVAPCRK
jgi:hypothetical protein